MVLAADGLRGELVMQYREYPVNEQNQVIRCIRCDNEDFQTIAIVKSAVLLCITTVPADTLSRLMEIVSLRLIRLAVLPCPPMHAIAYIAAGYLRSTTLSSFQIGRVRVRR